MRDDDCLQREQVCVEGWTHTRANNVCCFENAVEISNKATRFVAIHAPHAGHSHPELETFATNTTTWLSGRCSLLALTYCHWRRYSIYNCKLEWVVCCCRLQPIRLTSALPMMTYMLKMMMIFRLLKAAWVFGDGLILSFAVVVFIRCLGTRVRFWTWVRIIGQRLLVSNSDCATQQNKIVPKQNGRNSLWERFCFVPYTFITYALKSMARQHG